MKKLTPLFLSLIIAIGVGGFVVSNKACSTDTQLKTTVETTGDWKGFKMTEQGTYIAESFDQVYKQLKGMKYYQKQEKKSERQLIFSWEENNKLIEEKRKVVPQDYPKKAILSSFHPFCNLDKYVTAILFVPDTTLDQTENGNLGLTEVQYQAYQKDLMARQNRGSTTKDYLIKPEEVEVMHITCKLQELPSEIQTITKDLGLMLDIDYPPLVTKKDNTISVGYNRSFISNNSQYFYVLTKDGGVICLDGYYDGAGKFEKYKKSVAIDQVDRMMYLFFQPRYGVPDRDKGHFAYRAKIVVFNIEK